jgi:hypothetical protein
MAKVAAAVKGRVLVILSLTDHEVFPGSAIDFACLLHARGLKLDSDCGRLRNPEPTVPGRKERKLYED